MGTSGSAVAEDATGSPWNRLKGCCCLRGGLPNGPSAMPMSMQGCANEYAGMCQLMCIVHEASFIPRKVHVPHCRRCTNA